MKKITFFLLSLVFLGSCTGIFGPKEDPDFSSPDDEGNLLIENFSGHELLLFVNGKFIKRIPNSGSDFLIYIPNPSDGTIDLQLYKADDISDLEESPDINLLYKRWAVNLSNSTDIEKRVTWYISANEEEINSGTLKFSYVGGTDYQVDVYLNNRNGAKIITLKPGDQYEQVVGIDYGAYTLLYHYWYSDPNTTEGIIEVGWKDKEIVNGEEVDIWAVINDKHQQYYVQVPHFDAEPLNNKGTILIYNNFVEPVQVFANGQPIEEIMYLDGNTQAASIIPSDDNYGFILQNGTYTIEVQTLQSVETLAKVQVNIGAGDTDTLTVNGSNDYILEDND